MEKVFPEYQYRSGPSSFSSTTKDLNTVYGSVARFFRRKDFHFSDLQTNRVPKGVAPNGADLKIEGFFCQTRSPFL